VIDLLLGVRNEELAALRGEVAAKPRGDRSIVGRLETEISANPLKTITLDGDGFATIQAAGQRLDGGRFTTQSIAQLRSTGTGRPRFSVVCGSDPMTDIGFLQAHAEPKTLFQVASQFDCLEARDPVVVPVVEYLSDPTQGPRASISAFPGTLVRHYAAHDAAGRFVQSDEHHLNLLANALPAGARVVGGYLMTHELPDLEAAAASLERRFEEIRVGVHSHVPVLLGANWDGPVKSGQTIAQVFTSTLALGGYSEGATWSPILERICRQLLRAAYLGTVLAGVKLKQRRVVLTMIGGGVFGNPHRLIFDSILWALDQISAPIDVVLNGREVHESLGVEVLVAAAVARGGVVVEASGGKVRQLE
jgi:hypothetical protein